MLQAERTLSGSAHHSVGSSGAYNPAGSAERGETRGCETMVVLERTG
jgi:hypothetical protein